MHGQLVTTNYLAYLLEETAPSRPHPEPARPTPKPYNLCSAFRASSFQRTADAILPHSLGAAPQKLTDKNCFRASSAKGARITPAADESKAREATTEAAQRNLDFSELFPISRTNRIKEAT